MSVTCSDDRPDLGRAPHVPAYARGRTKSSKKIKTWMILAPIGAAVLIGGGALMVMGGGEEGPPLSDAEIAAPVLPATLLTPAPVVPDVAASTIPVAPDATTAPVQPSAAPVASTIQRRAAPERAAPVTPVIEAPIEPTGPRPYVAEAAPSTSGASNPTPPPPTITVQPLG